MNSDVRQLREMLQAHDPARRVHPDASSLPVIAQRIIDETARPPRTAVRRWSARRWLVAVSVTAVVTGAALAVTVVMPPDDVGSMQMGATRALAFTEDGDYVDVRIMDPDADPRRYRQDFTARGLNVDLQMKAVSPSLAGKMISVSSPARLVTYGSDGGFEVRDTDEKNVRIEGIEDESGCGDMWCQAGVRIPVGLRLPITIVFGRPARPGERYEITGDPTARGEVLEGLTLRNRTVAEVEALLRQRHTTVETYYQAPPPPSPGSGGWDFSEHVIRSRDVPGTWYVHEAFGGHDRNTVSLVVDSRPR
ncbi:hypothetical protein [Streptosporangium pseudovulgare]|uniref:DUF4179 domain-containing protein n=1 Tax=Streptosporangium pseudovulgare TaxID=35765 RepID=A0ABQ2QJ55_9ACTN|nr:hypothetical protein [Streptosporangium pseudovulgare]GGP84255.1 hypothetical protein GCM10010140_11580 [Streptosporangium pseudovulgare]